MPFYADKIKKAILDKLTPTTPLPTLTVIADMSVKNVCLFIPKAIHTR